MDPSTMRDPPVSVSPEFPSPTSPLSLCSPISPHRSSPPPSLGRQARGRDAHLREGLRLPHQVRGVAGLLLRLRLVRGVLAVASGGNPRSVSGYKMGKVHAAFQEFQHRRDGLIKALTANLDTIIEEAKKIGKETPYDQRKCLWGLEDKSWELRHAAYPCSEAPPQPEPLPPFEEGMSLIQWTRIVADFSYAWLATFSAYLSSSFTLEERYSSNSSSVGCLAYKSMVFKPYHCSSTFFVRKLST
nr:uncharacterized protein LOC127302767 isoform X4 [Lolium perenne]XP_051189292.1 uncharacterized protein LOC127302767 isoform X5 [Lolium perenne]XP_051189293.1 uncharacterized protein LOC127302767 isoform X6 [Lolium perenne]XP_051189294.1 uncharacterized protein LOC127302767 isoform X7 [Lolium perenne]